jgi:glucokinase
MIESDPFSDSIKMILAGDIGGTKVNLAIFQEDRGLLKLKEEATFASQKYSNFEDILREFLAQTKAVVDVACFGVCGPVNEGRCQVTNLPWVVEVKSLQAILRRESVWLINDLAAMAASLPFLDPEVYVVLQEGKECPNGRIAVIAAGTGLGQAFLVPDASGHYIILDSEGGHCDYPPRNQLESELLRFMLKKYERVSIERLLSGSGLCLIYEFVKQRHSFSEPEWLTAELHECDPAVAITNNGLQKKDEACVMALELFVTLYGAVAGNLALQLMTRRGIFVGGGMAPKMAEVMKSGLFREAFLSKGRFRSFVSEVPVKMIVNELAPLLGAAHYALGNRFRR